MIHLFDSSAYFRLAKPFHPLLGDYLGADLKILPQTNDEFLAQPRLRNKFAWFTDHEYVDNRAQNTFKLSRTDAEQVKNTNLFLKEWVREHRGEFGQRKLHPPSPKDCSLLAHAILDDVIVVADDGGLEHLSKEIDLPLQGSHRLLKQLQDMGVIQIEQIRAAAKYLEYEDDLPASWRRDAQAVFGCKLP